MLVLSPLLSAIAVFVAQSTSFETLPRGEYYYVHLTTGRPQHVLLRKAGRTVIGVDLQPIGEPMCFRGWFDGDRVVNATWLRPPYQPDSRLTHETGTLLDLTGYQPATTPPSDRDQAALQSCMNFFWR